MKRSINFTVMELATAIFLALAAWSTVGFLLRLGLSMITNVEGYRFGS